MAKHLDEQAFIGAKFINWKDNTFGLLIPIL
jgi:hypothetical protein